MLCGAGILANVLAWEDMAFDGEKLVDIIARNDIRLTALLECSKVLALHSLFFPNWRPMTSYAKGAYIRGVKTMFDLWYVHALLGIVTVTALQHDNPRLFQLQQGQ